jgi:carbamoyl-phosphate synthase large subunit
MRKLYITDKGKAWSGIVIDDPSLLKLTRKFTRDSRWKGGFELEIMRTEKEELYIMEINPRFPAWIYTTAAAGQNLPASLVNLVMGLPVSSFRKYEVGTMFVRYAWDNITHIREFEKISNYGER